MRTEVWIVNKKKTKKKKPFDNLTNYRGMILENFASVIKILTIILTI